MAKLHFAEKYPYCAKYLVWEYEDGRLRLGEGVYRDLLYPDTFTAAGKQYTSCKELCAELIDRHGNYIICRDIHGRMVFVVQREFPQRYSFDDRDWLGADRYNWEFYIMQEDRISKISYESRSTRIHVYDDADCLYDLDIKAMRELKWLESQ